MRNNHGQTLTTVFATSVNWMNNALINEAFRDFKRGGWEEQRDVESDFRCLTKFDADINMIRRAAKNNPGMIFFCYTVSCETKLTTLDLGIGGAWFSKARRFSKRLGLDNMGALQRYVRTMSRESVPQRARTAKSGGPSTRSTSTRQAKPKKALKPSKATQVHHRLVFHGLPDEVERCRAMALDTLPSAARARVKYETTGSESYLAGSMEFTTAQEPAFRVFNRLVAQVPGVTVVLEYDDLKSAQRRQLRAVDGTIVEHRPV